eukprot:3139290-Rhodomonas_salina.1
MHANLSQIPRRATVRKYGFRVQDWYGIRVWGAERGDLICGCEETRAHSGLRVHGSGFMVWVPGAYWKKRSVLRWRKSSLSPLQSPSRT